MCWKKISKKFNSRLDRAHFSLICSLRTVEQQEDLTMTVYVPRAPRANNAPNVLERMHTMQLLKLEAYGAKRSRRKKQLLQAQLNQQGLLAQSKLEQPSMALQQKGNTKVVQVNKRKFPKFFVGFDVAILAFVLVALFLPGSIPANLVSLVLGGK